MAQIGADLSRYVAPARLVTETVGLSWVSLISRMPVDDLPSDYKRLINCTGGHPAVVKDYLTLLVPAASDDEFDMTVQLHAQTDTLRTGGHNYREYPLFPSSGFLLPWAISDNGEVFYWLTSGSPDAWITIVEQSRDGEWYEHIGPGTELILDILEDRHDVPFIAKPLDGHSQIVPLTAAG